MTLLHLLLHPPLPISPLLPPTGSLAWLYRFLLLLPVLFILLPILTLFLPLSLLLPPSLAPFPPHPDWRGRGWETALRAWALPLINALIFAITAHGDPPRQPPRTIPLLPRLLFSRGVRVAQIDVPVLPCALRTGVLGVEGVNEDPTPCFWLAPPGWVGKVDAPRRREGEKVVVYLCGGGYVRGFPLEGACSWTLARTLNLRLLAVNYHKSLPPASSPSDSARPNPNSHPTPLLSALSALHHLRLLGFRPEEITLVGDSAGGGLVWGVACWLAHAAREGWERWEGGVGGVVMISPWLDLSLSHPSHHTNATHDFLNRRQLERARGWYVGRFVEVDLGWGLGRVVRGLWRWLGATTDARARARGKAPDDAADDLFDFPSFHCLGLAHPLISPSALAGVEDLSRLITACGFGGGMTREDDVGRADTPALMDGEGEGESEPSTRLQTPEESRAASVVDLVESGGVRLRRGGEGKEKDPGSFGVSTSTFLPPPPSLSSHPAAPLPSRRARTRFLIHHGTAELLHSECTHLAARLRAHGADVTEVVVPGGVHIGGLLSVTGVEEVGGVIAGWMAGGQAGGL